MPSQILLPISSSSSYLPPKSSTQLMFKPLIYSSSSSSSTTLLDGDDHSVKPLLSRASSFNGAVTPNGESTGLYQNRRRRSNSDNCLSAASPDHDDGTNGSQQQTIGQEVSHAAAETFLLTRLFLKLLSYLGYFKDPINKKRY